MKFRPYQTPIGSVPISSTCPTSFDWSLNLLAFASLAADCLSESSQQLEDFRHSVTTMKRTHFTNFGIVQPPTSGISSRHESIGIYVRMEE